MNKEQAIKLLRKNTSPMEIHKLGIEGLNKKEVTDKIQEAMDMGADALEKQVAKKPKDIDILVGFNTKEIKYGNCSVCFNEVNNNGMKYCACCGQKIDWSE